MSMIGKTLGHYRVGEQLSRGGIGVVTKRATRALLLLIIAVCCLGQEDLAKVLSFETEHPDGRPGGWRGGPTGTLFVDEKVVHSGRWSARLERTTDPFGKVLFKGSPNRGGLDYRVCLES